MILTIRTDKPKAELGLYEDNKQLAYVCWQAGRNLSKDLHRKIEELFKAQNIDYLELAGVILYKGPGSFTGLRIGASVAGTVASELDIPLAAVNGDDWIDRGLSRLKAEPDNRNVILEYGASPKTTKPKK